MGVVRWDGAPADLAGVEAMGRALRHRGEHPPRFWRQGPVVLGHCLLPTTPEAGTENLPVWWPAERVGITADARLDNRDELLAALGVDEAAPDSVLILRAYLRWGERCAEKLLGDFAFAVWDASRQQLVCVRDHFGVRPLFYVRQGDLVAFASEATALFSLLPAIAADVNPEVVGSFLAGMMVEEEDTFYRHVQRVLPAHVATFREGAKQTRRYYEFQGAELRLRSREEYAERFREIFTRAVARRLRSLRPVGCLLSGGLDSSAVACVARDLTRTLGGGVLPTYTNRYPDSPQCDESAYFQEVLGQGGFEPHFHSVSSVRTIETLEKLIATLGMPTSGLGMFTNDPLYPLIRSHGANTVLDGHGGDEVVSEVPAILRELAERNRWLAFAREWIPMARARRVPVWPPLRDCVLSYGHVGRWRRRLRLGQRLAALRGMRPPSSSSRPRWAEHLDPQFLAGSSLRARRTQWLAGQPDHALSSQEAHRRRVFNTAQGIAFEALDLLAGSSAVETRFPFWDKEVVEFCLTIPPEQKLAQGRDRSVLRAGLRGILPEVVRLRRGKTSFAQQAIRAFLSVGENNYKLLLYERHDFINTFVDKDWHRNAIARLYRTQLFDDLPKIWLATSVLTWLRSLERSRTGKES